MIARSILRIILLLAVFYPDSISWSADPQASGKPQENVVIKYDENFKGTLKDVVGKEIEIAGKITFGKNTPKSKAQGCLHGNFGFLFIPNWGDVWQYKKVRVIGKVSLYDGAEYMKDVWNNQPPAMHREDHFKITIRQIELLEDLEQETRTPQR